MEGIISYGLTLLLGIGVVGGFVVKYALKARKLLKALNETIDVIDKFIEVSEDKNVSEEDFQYVVAEIKQSVSAWSDLVKKA